MDTQQKIEEYREFLNEKTFLGEVVGDISERNQGIKHAVAVLSEEFHKLFPVEHTSEEPTISDLIMDTVDIPVDDGPTEEDWARKDIKQELGIADETDNIYPKH